MIESLSEFLTELGQLQANIQQKMTRAETEIACWRRRLDQIEVVYSVLKELGVKVEGIPPSRKRNREWVEGIVHDVADGVTDEQVLERLLSEGWTSNSDNPLGLVRSYLSRAYRSGRIHKFGRLFVSQKGSLR